ncbi:MAG TPA: hypothetical protein VE615_05885 [Gaiellaceae bacterium]|nr:hypothetical protein [Gaiellaceae bacterium]
MDRGRALFVAVRRRSRRRRADPSRARSAHLGHADEAADSQRAVVQVRPYSTYLFTFRTRGTWTLREPHWGPDYSTNAGGRPRIRVAVGR